MANQAGYFGFRPVKMLGAAYNGQGQNEYKIGNNEGSAIYQGDPVILVANGAIDVGSTAGAELIGIFNGCEYTDPTTGKPTFSNYYPASTNAADIIANVIDDPNAVFEIQADAAFPVADLAGNYDILATAGDTVSGTSRIELEVGTADSTVATLPLKAIDISQDPENSDVSSANTNVIVKINNHLFSGGTAGLA